MRTMIATYTAYIHTLIHTSIGVASDAHVYRYVQSAMVIAV